MSTANTPPKKELPEPLTANVTADNTAMQL